MYHKIKSLRDQHSVRGIATLLDISKETVQKYTHMSLQEASDYLVQVKRRSEFDSYRDFIETHLSQSPRLSGAKLYRKLKLQYPDVKSGHRAFRNYIRPIREQYKNTQIRNYRPIFADLPGEQVQVDPGEYSVQIDSLGNKQKIYFVSFVFSCSRMMFASFQTRPYNTEDFIKAHVEAFQYFGGVAKEYVYDQTKLVVIKEKYREVLYNERFHQFALQYEFLPVVCEGYDPESKGKVERSIRYIKDSFLYGDVFSNIESLRKQSLVWLNEVANVRIHATTKQQHCEMFLAEKSFLNTRYYAKIDSNKRLVDKTGLLSFNGNKYSVPSSHQRLEVLVKEVNGNLVIRDIESGKELATHLISMEKGKLITNINHYRDFRKSIEELTTETMFALSEVEQSEELVNKLKSDNPRISRDQLRALKKLATKFPPDYWTQIIPNLLSLPSIRATLIEKMLFVIRQQERVQEINSRRPTIRTPESSILDRSGDVYMVGVKNA